MARMRAIIDNKQEVNDMPDNQNSSDRTDMDVILEAYRSWPEDIRKKLSLHDLRRMTGWRPPPQQPAPAMLNGLEGLVAKWRRRAQSNIRRGQQFGDGYRIAGNNINLCADELEGLCAADNRDAAGVAEFDAAIYAMFRALVDAGGAMTVARHGAMPRPEALFDGLQRGMLAIERRFHPERYDDFPIGKPTPTAAPAGEAVAWMHGVCADDGEEDQVLSFSPDNFPLEGVAGYRKVWCRPLIYGDTHPPAAEVREVREAMVERGAVALRAIQRKDPKFEDISLTKMANAVLTAALSPPGRAEGEG